MHHIKTLASKITGYKVLATVGSIIFLGGALLDGLSADDLRTLGAVVLVASLARWSIRPALIPQVDLYRAGHESGYDEGFHDGRRTMRPILIRGGLDDDQASMN